MTTTLSTARPTDAREDAELVAAVRAGDDRAYEALYERYHRRITLFLHAKVGDWGRAEDLTQEVFLSALRRMRETDRPIAFKPWVYEIAKNASIDQFRRARRTEEVSYEAAEELRSVEQERLAARAPAPDVAVEVGQQLEHLRGAFGSLSDSHHRILVMRELEGRSYREIGQKMNLSRPGVESTLFRARRRLSEEYVELATGARCRRVREKFEAVLMGRAGVRDRRRVERHLAWCRTCRADARTAGLESSMLIREGAGARVAALLPLPLLFRRGPESSFVQSAAASPGLLDAAASSWKAAAAALALAAASSGAGAASQASGAPLEPEPAAPKSVPALQLPLKSLEEASRLPRARPAASPAPAPPARPPRVRVGEGIGSAVISAPRAAAPAGPAGGVVSSSAAGTTRPDSAPGVGSGGSNAGVPAAAGATSAQPGSLDAAGAGAPGATTSVPLPALAPAPVAAATAGTATRTLGTLTTTVDTVAAPVLALTPRR